MATITEDYVSFEIAKLLKEKGFDEKVISFYPPGDIQRPTLQMAMKWLREVHNINLNIIFIKRFDKGYWNKGCWTFNNIEYKSYEQACETAIKYCLENLI
jgi:hypothetical protein